MYTTVLLLWLGVEDTVMKKALSEGTTITSTDLTYDSGAISCALLDENVDPSLVRPMFQPLAWGHVTTLIDQKRRSHVWLCGCCHCVLEDNHSIVCDACFTWYHLKCCGLARPPKKKSWMCRICYQTAKF